MKQKSQNEGKYAHPFFFKPNEPSQSSLFLLGEVQQVPRLQKYFCCWACSFLCPPAACPSHFCLGLGLSGWASCWLKFSSKANVAATGCNSTEWFNMPSGNSYVNRSFSLKLCSRGNCVFPIPRKKKAEEAWGAGCYHTRICLKERGACSSTWPARVVEPWAVDQVSQCFAENQV